MNFNEPIFLFLFLPLFMFGYFLAQGKGKLIFGVLGSFIFYSWGNLSYIPLIIALGLLTYVMGYGIDRWRGKKTSQIFLGIGITLIVILLITYKAFSERVYPLGLSYLTFQGIAYLIESFKKVDNYEKDLLKFSFYFFMFPKIPIGPIIRYSQVKDDLFNIKTEPSNVADGLRRFIRGFAKKALIADVLAQVVNSIFNLSSPTILPSIAWLVIISYSIQLYFDFSGYSDMAIGLAKMMGIRFVENFDSPYLSKSIGEFWRRWHISLSTWFRDFVFYPLQRMRLTWLPQPVIILIVFTLTGLWHGFTQNFLIWGFIHGLAIVLESTFLGRKLQTVWVPIQHLYTLGIVLVGWVFFRSPTPDFALDFIRRLLGDMTGYRVLPFEQTSPFPFIEPTFVLALSIGISLSIINLQTINNLFYKLAKNNKPIEFVLLLLGDLVLIAVLIFSLAATTSASFLPVLYKDF